MVKLVGYRSDYYGDPMQALTQEAMRGPSSWSVGDREWMAAVVARANECEWCVRAHSAVAAGAYRDRERVAKALSDIDSAPIEEPLRATSGPRGCVAVLLDELRARPSLASQVLGVQ